MMNDDVAAILAQKLTQLTVAISDLSRQLSEVSDRLDVGTLDELSSTKGGIDEA